ncbi:MAG: hypothetical protein NDI69_13690 [Bacteriovoracaceae bacterium]|nr:hypothetical protein [Bacteriovoracaceae bacterium]
MKSFFLIIIFISISCSSHREPTPTGLIIVEINPDKGTYLTKQNLQQLEQVYDLSPFFYTRKVLISSDVNSHPAPDLTLTTHFAENPRKLLAAWLHEEFYWWTEQNKAKLAPVLKELQNIYPRASGHAHLLLIICNLEFKALSYYLGDKEAKKTINDLMKKDRLFPWTYYQVLNRNAEITKLMNKYDLIPAPL